MLKVIPEGYRKLVFGLICLLGALIFQYLTLDNPTMWKDAPGFITPSNLFYAALIIGVGGNFADKLPFLKSK